MEVEPTPGSAPGVANAGKCLGAGAMLSAPSHKPGLVNDYQRLGGYHNVGQLDYSQLQAGVGRVGNAAAVFIH